MKTFILISSLAACFLLIAFAESGNFNSSMKSDLTPGRQESLHKDSVSTSTRQQDLHLSQTEATEVVSEPFQKDLSYLQFEVSDYLAQNTTDSLSSEELPQSEDQDFSHLKFDVGKYMPGDYSTSGITEELPIAESHTNSATITF